jgi:hypothetical protein
MQHLITRGFGLNQSIIVRGFGGIFHWFRKLISDAFVLIIRKKIPLPGIIEGLQRGGHINITNGKRNK